MSWKESLTTDIVSVDQQHHHLIEQLQAFFKAVEAGQSRAETVQGLDALVTLVAAHFEHEELVMRNIHLPSLMVHESLHRALLEEIREFREEVAMGTVERPFAEIEHFLNAWLYRHIVEEDVKIHHHLNRA